MSVGPFVFLSVLGQSRYAIFLKYSFIVAVLVYSNSKKLRKDAINIIAFTNTVSFFPTLIFII